MQRRILHAFVRLLFDHLSHLDVVGLERIPLIGAYILATNHLSRIDSALVFALLEREDVTGLVGDSYKKIWIMRWLLDIVGGIWVNRQAADVGAMRESLEFLHKGGLLGLAPEGTRSHTGGLIPAKTGVAYLADKACVPIIPIALYGTEHAIDMLLRLRRPTIHVRFGESFLLPPLDRRDRAAGLQRNTDEIMCRIAAMLPEGYRGVYSNNPRLHELFVT